MFINEASNLEIGNFYKFIILPDECTGCNIVRILETVRDTAVAKLYIKVALPLDPLLAVDKFQKVFPRNPKKKIIFF